MVTHALYAQTLVNGLGLLLSKGIERLQWGNALSCSLDKGQRAVLIGCELFHARRALIASPTRQFAVVVEQIVVALELNRTAVNGETIVGLSHHLALIGPRSGNFVGCGVGPMFGHTACGILQIVLPITFVDPRSLLEVGLRRAVVVIALVGTKGFLILCLDLNLATRNGRHRLREFGIPQHVVAIEEVGLSVIINHDRGVNFEPSFYQRLPDRVTVRPCGIVGHSHADTGIGLTLDGGRYIPVPLAVTLYALAGPAVVILLGPSRKGGRGQRRATIRPVHHVDR